MRRAQTPFPDCSISPFPPPTIPSFYHFHTCPAPHLQITSGSVKPRHISLNCASGPNSLTCSSLSSCRRSTATASVTRESSASRWHTVRTYDRAGVPSSAYEEGGQEVRKVVRVSGEGEGQAGGTRCVRMTGQAYLAQPMGGGVIGGEGG